jgi:hypothetical protein
MDPHQNSGNPAGTTRDNKGPQQKGDQVYRSGNRLEQEGPVRPRQSGIEVQALSEELLHR